MYIYFVWLRLVEQIDYLKLVAQECYFWETLQEKILCTRHTVAISYPTD